MVGLGDLSGGDFSSFAFAVSNDGSVVVGSSTTVSTDAAFIWTSSRGMRNLRDVLISDYGLDMTGWTLTVAADISADGRTLVGYGTDPAGNTEAWIATIPEPASAVVFAIATFALLQTRRAFRGTPQRSGAC
jgi:probable HAF family extracellular repeat protein